MAFSIDNIEDLNKKLFEVLECPVCMKCLSFPIRQCASGHSICSTCLPKCENCPLCRASFTKARNYALEQLSQITKRPCKNHVFGCNETYLATELTDHEAYCLYRQNTCLIDNCTWNGSINNLLRHAKKKHRDAAWMTDANDMVFDFDYSESRDIEIISAFHEIFWFHWKIDTEKRMVFIGVQYIGADENSYTFMYKVKFCSSDGTRKYSVTRKTHKETVNMENVFKYCDCPHINFDAVKFFVQDEKLKFCLDIERV